jgi:hypothetical protein
MLRNSGLAALGFEWASLNIMYRVYSHTVNPFHDLPAQGWLKQYKYIGEPGRIFKIQ